jgi:hypothetical chaperone protein
MTQLRYGLDYGTSNSAIALARDGAVQVLAIDPTAQNPRMASSVLFVEREGGARTIGAEAIQKFVTLNTGRAIVKQRVNTGKVIESFFNETKQQIHVAYDADLSIPGRFFQSLKSFLRDTAFEGTNVFGRWHTLEELIAVFLRLMKERADAIVGQAINAVVMGRPVHFSDDHSRDVAAQARLLKAAHLAGFTDVQFVYEPLGAAYDYEATLTRDELAFVFDFGGGTLDFTVMRLGPQRRPQAERKDDILSVGGVVIGGNALNEDIMERRLLEYFGSRATGKTLAGKELRYPQWLLSQLQAWHTIPLLNEKDTIRFLEEFRVIAKHHQTEIDALLCLVQKNYGWSLFQEIERAKIELSSALETQIVFEHDVIRVREPLSRRSFERLIMHRLSAIDAAMDRTLADANVLPQEIDVVLRTGGSSLIPAVQAMLEKKFGAAKVKKQEVFTSIVSGLARAGRY